MPGVGEVIATGGLAERHFLFFSAVKVRPCPDVARHKNAAFVQIDGGRRGPSHKSLLSLATMVVPSRRYIPVPVSTFGLVLVLSRASSNQVETSAFQPLIPVAASPSVLTKL